MRLAALFLALFSGGSALVAGWMTYRSAPQFVQQSVDHDLGAIDLAIAPNGARYLTQPLNEDQRLKKFNARQHRWMQDEVKAGRRTLASFSDEELLLPVVLNASQRLERSLKKAMFAGLILALFFAWPLHLALPREGDEEDLRKSIASGVLGDGLKTANSVVPLETNYALNFAARFWARIKALFS